jgi:hypothetical protein
MKPVSGKGRVAAPVCAWPDAPAPVNSGFPLCHSPPTCLPDVEPHLTMPLFWKPYKSDVTDFIETLKAKKPSLEAEQRAGRALLWDKQVDRDAQAEDAESRVPQRPYVYQTGPK